MALILRLVDGEPGFDPSPVHVSSVVRKAAPRGRGVVTKYFGLPC